MLKLSVKPKGYLGMRSRQTGAGAGIHLRFGEYKQIRVRGLVISLHPDERFFLRDRESYSGMPLPAMKFAKSATLQE